MTLVDEYYFLRHRYSPLKTNHLNAYSKNESMPAPIPVTSGESHFLEEVLAD